MPSFNHVRRGVQKRPFLAKNDQTWQGCWCPKVVYEGPKWSKMINSTYFWSLWTILGSLGHFRIISDKTWFLLQITLAMKHFSVIEAKNQLFVWKDPKCASSRHFKQSLCGRSLPLKMLPAECSYCKIKPRSMASTCYHCCNLPYYCENKGGNIAFW